MMAATGNGSELCWTGCCGQKKNVNERMVLMIKVALLVLGFAAGAACAAVKAAAFQQEKYRN